MMAAADPQDRSPLPAGVISDADHDPVHPAERTVRGRVVDAACFLLAVGVVVLTLADSRAQHIAPGPLTVDLVLGGLCSLGVWLRRRWPVGLAVAAGLVSVYATSAAGAALIALFTVAVHRRFAVVARIAAGYALVPFLTLLVRPDVPVGPWSQIVLGVVFALAVLAWGMFVRARRQSLRDRARRVEAEQELRVAEARQGERNRIAREMHDVLAHRLSLLSLHAGALELRPDAASEEVARAAGVVRDSAYQALEDLRKVIGVLRTGFDRSDETPERPQPTLADLPDLVDQSRRAGMTVRLDCQTDALSTVPAGVGRSAYRIVQEGLTNARKHAPDAEVAVTVRATPGDSVTVEIRNPCPMGTGGGTPIPGAGIGLIGLTERAALAGGHLEHGPTPAGEFRLWAWLPWPTR
ncbi:sensor histidine kinase [Actinophytocola algeriensis]|uniref:histidine kinase n=1 Tax=Actinophytocola algeriensis TaxID=1768010 RepID=A0A7W7Q3X7_9PSEU|nr:histidine kinase [Actinophytocola algeriensis]MBB4906259.1 signal transduction histidine kinase [Actinophytocola algeriensis]MBE1472056.1 signal transduction histidine kinase [Actinophytocola algeriensis]